MNWIQRSFVLLALCLGLVPGTWAQAAKTLPPAANDQPRSAAVAPGCGYSAFPLPIGPRENSGRSRGASGHPSLVLISAHDDRESEGSANPAGIVGLWQFTFVAKGNDPPGPPDGATVDAGYVTWHSDGTELMNSGRAPTTGDFCMGVWKQVGRSTFKLNHFALAWAWDPVTPATGPGTGGADFVGPANIREEVTLDRSGNSYQGTFTLVQYAADGKTVLATVTGTITATRITVD